MSDCTSKVADFISKAPYCRELGASLDTTMSKMIKFTVKQFHLLKLHSSTGVFLDSAGIVAYPESDVNEIYSIMTSLGIECIPVAKNPWNKKLIGYLNVQQLEEAFKK